MICNATPLICLAKINQIDILKMLFHEIIIPKAVEDEVVVEGKPGYAIIKKAIENGWIKILNPKNNLDLELGKGENSAINLAREKKDSLILDDAFAIRVATSFNIPFFRTTSIILLALRKKIINKNQAISHVQELIKIGYYLSPEVYMEILNIINSF